jgi:predicted DCC family thiol-disulfide oxidoreductase YuxK
MSISCLYVCMFVCLIYVSNNMKNKTNPDPKSSCENLTVMYDGACPLCRREIGIYQSLSPLEPVSWLDVSAKNENMSPEDQSRFMARFHVRTKDGHLLSGAAAFVALWLTMPGWRWLGRFGQLPGMTELMEVFYNGFLRIRPSIQKLFK